MASPLLTTDAPDAAQTLALAGGAIGALTAATTLITCALRGGSRKEACVEAATAPLEATNKLSVGDRLLKVEKEKEELEEEKKAAGVAYANLEKEKAEEIADLLDKNNNLASIVKQLREMNVELNDKLKAPESVLSPTSKMLARVAASAKRRDPERVGGLLGYLR